MIFPSENYKGGVSPVSVASCAVIVMTGLFSSSYAMAETLSIVNVTSLLSFAAEYANASTGISAFSVMLIVFSGAVVTILTVFAAKLSFVMYPPTFGMAPETFPPFSSNISSNFYRRRFFWH